MGENSALATVLYPFIAWLHSTHSYGATTIHGHGLHYPIFICSITPAALQSDPAIVAFTRFPNAHFPMAATERFIPYTASTSTRS